MTSLAFTVGEGNRFENGWEAAVMEAAVAAMILAFRIDLVA